MVLFIAPLGKFKNAAARRHGQNYLTAGAVAWYDIPPGARVRAGGIIKKSYAFSQPMRMLRQRGSSCSQGSSALVKWP